MRRATPLIAFIATLTIASAVGNEDLAEQVSRLSQRQEQQEKLLKMLFKDNERQEARILELENEKYTDDALGKELAQLNEPRYMKKASRRELRSRNASTNLSPLEEACETGDLNKVKWLVWSGVDIHRADPKDKQTPLFRASSKGHLAIARLLVAKGAVVDRADQFGSTPLKVACRHGHLEVARLLLDSGADANRADDIDLDTPLHAACLEGALEVARLLLDHGADKSRVCYEGFTPLQLAPRRMRRAFTRLFELY